MSAPTTADIDTFNHALGELAAFMQGATDAHLSANGYNWREAVTIDNPLAPVYVRFLKTMTNGQRSCMGFVRRSDGAILYSAGWKGPYLKGKSVVRGSIYDASTWPKCIGPHGVRTVR